MKNARFPLYAKILLWFFLNLLVVAAVLFVIASEHFRVGPELLAIGGAGERIRGLAELISGQLEQRPRREWDAELKRFGAQFAVEFLIYRNNAEQIAGTPTELPADVRQRLTERLGRGFPGRPPIDQQEDGPADRPPGLGPPPGARPPFIVRSDNPRRYWIGVNVRAPERPPERRGPATLLIVSKDLRAGGLLFDFAPWLWTGAGVLVFSLFFWIPLVRHITRPVAQMQAATAQIAEGNFNARVSDRRRDEVGALGQSINRMATRLAGFVGGQKRFLGDIAHELCTPLARMQMALGILEQRADDKSKAYVDDVRDEVQHMSHLVNELLSFSKASLGASNVRLQAIELAPLVEKAIKRESATGSDIRSEVAPGVMATADPELIVRAISNLLRNAVRYAGDAGPITVSATQHDTKVEILVSDCGPGVPDSELPKLFDPFYRVDTSRARETGGVGLGLSIVKTCVESCGGTVLCRNRQPHGFEVVITLNHAEPGPPHRATVD